MDIEKSGKVWKFNALHNIQDALCPCIGRQNINDTTSLVEGTLIQQSLFRI